MPAPRSPCPRGSPYTGTVPKAAQCKASALCCGASTGRRPPALRKSWAMGPTVRAIRKEEAEGHSETRHQAEAVRVDSKKSAIVNKRVGLKSLSPR